MDDRRRPACRARVRTRLVSLLASLLGLGALLAPAASSLDVGDVVPPLTLRTPEGRAFTLQDELGQRPMLLAFVSPRCAPCRESRPALEQLCQTYGADQRLALVSVTLGAESARQEAGAESAHSSSCTETLVLGDEVAAKKCGVYATPVFLLVGRQGTVLWKHVGRLVLGRLEAALAPELSALESLTP